MEKTKIIMASGQMDIDELVKQFDEYEVVGTVEYRESLLKECKEKKPNILIVGDLLGGKKALIPILIQIKHFLPELRIIYFTGSLDMQDEVKINMLGTLCSLGIYDIIHEDTISPQMIQHIILTPRGKDSVQHILSRVKDSAYNRKKKPIEISIPDDISMEDSQAYRNLYMFSSPKNGTGKSFLLSNIAVAIANMGVNNINGKKPRIAVIDTDISGFALGNIYRVQDDNKNILKAITEIKKVVNKQGDLIGTDAELRRVNEEIKTFFKPHPKYRNIEILTGVERPYKEEDSSFIEPHDLVYLLETIVSDYDVIIVDTNSDIEYRYIYPLLYMCREIYFVMNMDYNTFNNDARFKNYLDNFGVVHKIKYVLNQYIEDEKLSFDYAKMEELGYDFVSKVPIIDPVMLLNSMYEGESIVMDTSKETLYIRYEILKLAHNLWPIKNFDKISSKMEKLNEPSAVEEKEESFFTKIGSIFTSKKEKPKNSKKNKKDKDKETEEAEVVDTVEEKSNGDDANNDVNE